ncbi:hypothetical protein KPL74_18165 [Bacillus sp. NP157]|nr:hypothetical protein KPL74_18165 [Bacillus sp. NP157]
MNVQGYRWRDAARWERWSQRMIDGVTYSFEHLRDFDMTLSRPARNNLPPFCVSIRVVFDCHVVTEAAQPHAILERENRAPCWIDSGGRECLFSRARYLRSLGLPALIRGLLDGATRCYVASYHNYMMCEQVRIDDRLAYYQVYFDLYRPVPEPRLVMYVQSAYVKDVPTAASRRHVKPFATLCAEKMGAVPSGDAASRPLPADRPGARKKRPR